MFKENMKKLLKENNLTQKDLALNLSIPTSTISSWIKDDRKPNYETLISIANYFEISVDYLIGRSDDFGNIKIKAPDLDDEEQELIDLYRDSTPGEREAVLTLMRRRKSTKQGYNIG